VTDALGDDEESVRRGVVRFVQSLEYRRDSDDTGHKAYPKYPVETLVHRRGDCEDGVILLGALMQALGYSVAPLVAPEISHMLLGVAADTGGASVDIDGSSYYVVETTDTGWDLGELPPNCRGTPFEAHTSEDTPVLVHEWSARPVPGHAVEIDVHVTNFGTGVADRVDGVVRFERRDGTVVADTRLIDNATIEPGQSVHADGCLRLPDGRSLRGYCRLGVGGVLHDESSSNWH
jgi:hypothetical protein